MVLLPQTHWRVLVWFEAILQWSWFDPLRPQYIGRPEWSLPAPPREALQFPYTYCSYLNPKEFYCG